MTDARVTLLAHTVLTDDAFEVLPYWSEEHPPHPQDVDHLAEIAGRQSYNSWSRPNSKTAANRDYLANIIRQQHTSVLAHGSFTFRFTNVSRNLTLELIRSRWWSFSQESQRYVSMDDSETVIPPLYRDDQDAQQMIQHVHDRAVLAYNDLVEHYIAQGESRKRAREAARCVLPGGTSTSLIASANCRAIRDFLFQRWSVHADQEIRQLAGEVLTIVRNYAPNTFQDIPDTPFE